MSLNKPYTDVPGTTIFDADQSRKGYHLNQFCMSLMKAENRDRYRADERAYLDEWPMTEAQRQAVLARDLNRCLEEGGNIYFLAKIGATDGRSFQYMAASMTGMSQEEYAAMMLAGGRGIQGNRRRTSTAGRPPSLGEKAMNQTHARISASVYTSHVPAIGAALDLGKSGNEYWSPLFQGYEPSKQWVKDNRPDVIFLVYNDHATAFSLEMIPTFAIGCADRFNPGRRGLGPPSGADRDRPPRAGGAHLPVGDPAGFRPDHRQQDGRRPRPHGAVVADVRPTRGLAVPDHPLCGQRGAVSGAFGPALLPVGAGDPPRHRELRSAPERTDLGYWRHEPPVAGAARRPDQRASSTTPSWTS